MKVSNGVTRSVYTQMFFVPHTFYIKIDQITQFYLYLTYDQRFYSFMNRALCQITGKDGAEFKIDVEI